MKRLLFIFVVFVSLMSCSNEDTHLDVVIENSKVTSCQDVINRRSFDEIVEIAKNSISMLQNNYSVTRSCESVRTLDLSNGVKVICEPKTRAYSEDLINDTLLYILNFNEDQGFAVVSACRQTDGLIAVTESGHYDPSVPTGIPGFDSYMAMAYNYVAQESRKNISVITRSANPIMCKPVYDTIFYKNIDPKIQVRWGQTGRMGQFCSNGISGCSNTAAAQIMSYFKYPNSLALNYSGRDVNTTALNWTSICQHAYTNVTNNRDNADLQIGRLARQLGQNAGSTYNQNSTSTSISSMRSALSSLGYNVGNIVTISPTNGVFADEDLYAFPNILSNNNLIFMRGENEDDNGHAWVIDGCYYVKALYQLLATYDGTTWSVYQEMGTYRTCHNHINWGWDGICNGYFNGWIYNANNAQRYDTEVSNYASSDAAFVKNYRYFSITH